MEETCAEAETEDIRDSLTSSGEKWENNGTSFTRDLMYRSISLKILANVPSNDLEI